MHPAMLQAEALERRTADRRKAGLAAYRAGERRAGERRASDSAKVGAWLARYHAARLELGA